MDIGLICPGFSGFGPANPTPTSNISQICLVLAAGAGGIRVICGGHADQLRQDAD